MIGSFKLLPKFLLVMFLCLLTQKASAVTYFASVAYQNPLPSLMGVNFKMQWNRVAVEMGLGYQPIKEHNKSSEEMRFRYGIAGDLDIKYYWFDDWFRPYVEGGLIIHPTSRFTMQKFSVGSKTSSGFVSAGIWMGGEQLFCYIASSFIEGSPRFQVGVGTAIY